MEIKMNQAINQQEILREYELIESMLALPFKPAWITPEVEGSVRNRQLEVIHILNALTKPKMSLREILKMRLKRQSSSITMIQSTKIETGFIYQGKFYACSYFSQIFQQLLKKLFEDKPEKRETIAWALNRAGRNRTYISDDQSNLFRSKTTHWIKGHSKKLIDGWYIDKNVNIERIQKLLPKAILAAGLKLEVDVKIIWPQTYGNY